MGLAAAVNDGSLVPLCDAAYGDGGRLAGRALYELCPARIQRYGARREDVQRYAHNTTSDVASYTAKASGRSTPITSPLVNFTRTSSVTEPFAGKAKVSVCESGR